MERAEAYRLIGFYRNAFDDLTVALDLDPQHLGAILAKTKLLLELHAYEKSLTLLDKAAEFHPDQGLIFYYRAQAHLALNKLTRASDDLFVAEKLLGLNSGLVILQAFLALKNQNKDSVLSILNQNKVPNQHLLSSTLLKAFLYAKERKYSFAIELGQRILQEAPQNLETLFLMAKLSYATGDLDNAIWFANKSLVYGKRYRTEANIVLAKSYFKQERYFLANLQFTTHLSEKDLATDELREMARVSANKTKEKTIAYASKIAIGAVVVTGACLVVAANRLNLCSAGLNDLINIPKLNRNPKTFLSKFDELPINKGMLAEAMKHSELHVKKALFNTIFSNGEFRITKFKKMYGDYFWDVFDIKTAEFLYTKGNENIKKAILKNTMISKKIKSLALIDFKNPEDVALVRKAKVRPSKKIDDLYKSKLQKHSSFHDDYFYYYSPDWRSLDAFENFDDTARLDSLNTQVVDDAGDLLESPYSGLDDFGGGSFSDYDDGFDSFDF